MKLKLVLETTTKNGKPYVLKLSIPPSKQKGFSHLIEFAQTQGNDIHLSFEKIQKGKQGKTRKKSNVGAVFQLEKQDSN